LFVITSDVLFLFANFSFVLEWSRDSFTCYRLGIWK